MRSRRDRVSVQRKPFPRKDFFHGCRFSAGKRVWALLLVAATLLFAIAAGILPPAVAVQAGAMAQPVALAPAALLQDTPESSVETPELLPTETSLPPEEPGEPPPTGTPQPPATA